MSNTDASKPNDPGDGLPRQIGSFRIQRLLGEGGMATVYAALQTQPRRTVAVKIMRGAVNAEAAVRRFRQEIEIVGRLRHPNIAQVYSAGIHSEAESDLPFFVMEYVPGARTILEYAKTRKLSLRARLRLFIKVCSAVEHGHRSRIIHRDLKPGNILIDGAGEPKIIDFGVARAIEADVTSQTMQMEVGRLVGTLKYMAPEQLESGPRDLDARCDVYALGVVLYRLLTGRRPYDLEGLSLFSAAQIVRVQPPLKPGAIDPALRGDLERIMLRALAKDRSHRYPDAGSLGRDLVRYLRTEPIKARRAGTFYRLGLFLRRRRTEVRAGLIVAVVVIVCAAIIVGQRVRTPRVAAPPASPSRDEPLAGPGPAGSPAATADDTAASTAEAPPPRAYTLEGLTGANTAIRFDPGGTALVAASADRGLVLWELADRRAVFQTADHDVPVRFLAFSSDGSILASADGDGKIVFLDTADGSIRSIVRHAASVIQAMALSPDGTLLAIAGDDLTLRLVTSGGRTRNTIRGTRGGFLAVAFSPEGDRVAAGSDRGTVYEWRVEDGNEIARHAGLRERVAGVGFTADGRRLVAVSAGGAGRAWSAGADADGVPLATTLGDLVEVAFDPTGRWMACASRSRIKIWSLGSSEPTGESELPVESSAVNGLAVAPDGRWFAVGDAVGTVHVGPFAEPQP